MPRYRLVAALPLILLTAVTAAGCGDPSDDPRNIKAQPTTGPSWGYCPLPEEQGPTPSPCILCQVLRVVGAYCATSREFPQAPLSP